MELETHKPRTAEDRNRDESAKRNFFLVIILTLLFAMVAEDYYEYIHLGKDMTGKTAFAKSFAYMYSFYFVARILNKE